MRRVSCICHWVAAAALAAAAGLAHAHEVGGRVVAVQDGDTVTILDAARVQHRVRIAGIDAPEKSQAFGEVAKQSLARLVHGRHVEARCPKRDRFGREVCSVFLGAIDVGLEQVRGGYAWWYREYAREQTPDGSGGLRGRRGRRKAGPPGPLERSGAGAALGLPAATDQTARGLRRARAYFERVRGTKRTGIVRRVTVEPSGFFSMTCKSCTCHCPPTGITSRPPGLSWSTKGFGT